MIMGAGRGEGQFSLPPEETLTHSLTHSFIQDITRELHPIPQQCLKTRDPNTIASPLIWFWELNPCGLITAGASQGAADGFVFFYFYFLNPPSPPFSSSEVWDTAVLGRERGTFKREEVSLPDNSSLLPYPFLPVWPLPWAGSPVKRPHSPTLKHEEDPGELFHLPPRHRGA